MFSLRKFFGHDERFFEDVVAELEVIVLPGRVIVPVIDSRARDVGSWIAAESGCQIGNAEAEGESITDAVLELERDDLGLRAILGMRFAVRAEMSQEIGVLVGE